MNRTENGQAVSKGVSRRSFMAMAGGTLGMAVLASAGLGADPAHAAGCTPNLPDIDAASLPVRSLKTDVLVVGSGMAGVFAAVKAHDAGADTLMVSKGRIGASGMTPFARGFFAYDPASAKMSLDQYVKAVSHSALGTNNPLFTRQTAKHSLELANELKSWGFFDSVRFAESLSAPVEKRNIPVLERVMLTHLNRDKGKISGAAGFSVNDGTLYHITAKSVILCTGAGGFKPNGFPVCDLTHDGSVMAYRIGARITGKEWNDGHGGNLKNSASVYDQWRGVLERNPSVTGIGIRHDLGVDQNYRTYIQGPGSTRSKDRPKDRPQDPMAMGRPVEGGPYRPSGLDRNGPPGPPPGDASDKTARRGHHPPPGMRGAPSGGASAGMSIHKSEGLVPYDENGASNIPGLYAAGDALGSHMCGGIYTQIGSSLAGSAVQGAIAGKAAAGYAKTAAMPALSDRRKKQVREEILAPLTRKQGYSPAWVTQTLQGIMIPNFVLYIKKEPMMQAALAYVAELRDHHGLMLKASDLHELRLAHETANMIVNAEMKMRASIMRKESRCSHYRLDYPDMDTENWNAWINIYKGKDGTMTLEKQPFGQWPS